MEDVPSKISKMNDLEIGLEKTLGEAYQNKRAGNINAMNDLKDQANAAFITNAGSGSFTVPELVTRLYVTGAGAGGGGMGHLAGLTNTLQSPGGAGGEFYTAHLSVTPGQVMSYNIGAGGNGGQFPTGSVVVVNADSGEPTTFNGLTWLGGAGGNHTDLLAVGHGYTVTTAVKKGGFSGNSGPSNFSASLPFTTRSDGETTVYAAGGTGGSVSGTPVLGPSAGGGASYGGGGAGGNWGAIASNGGDGVYGGGGGGGGFDNTNVFYGGRGGDGIILIRW